MRVEVVVPPPQPFGYLAHGGVRLQILPESVRAVERPLNLWSEWELPDDRPIYLVKLFTLFLLCITFPIPNPLLLVRPGLQRAQVVPETAWHNVIA